MQPNPQSTKEELEALIASEILRLIDVADICVFALYDPAAIKDGPVDFDCRERDPDRGTLDARVDFDFEGIGVWYIARRFGELFRLRHIMVQVHKGRFVRGQVEHFEGYWEEFPDLVANDRWLRGLKPLPGLEGPSPKLNAPHPALRATASGRPLSSSAT